MKYCHQRAPFVGFCDGKGGGGGYWFRIFGFEGINFFVAEKWQDFFNNNNSNNDNNNNNAFT